MTSIKPVPECDVTWAIEATLSHHDAGGYVFAPNVMAENALAYQQVQEAARQNSPEGPINWEDWFMDVYPNGQSFTEIVKDVKNIPEWCIEPIYNYLAEAAETANGKPFEDLSRETINGLFAFINEPTDEIAKTNPILKVLPDAHKMMLDIEAARRTQYAKIMCQRCPQPIALQATLLTPEQLKIKYEGVFELWVWVSPDSNNINPEKPDIYLLSASLLFYPAATPDKAELIGILSGHYIPTSNADHVIHHSDLLEVMDAHSQMLNDVWKSIYGELLPSLSKDDIQELADDIDDYVGICVPWISIAAPHRGNKLALYLLHAVAGVCAEAGTHAYENEIADDHQDEDDDDVDDWLEEDDGEYSPFTMLEENPICLYVLPIEGTRPEVMDWNPIARTSLEKLPPKKVLDMDIERRRAGLCRYFGSINDTQTAFVLHTYDPWSYTNT